MFEISILPSKLNEMIQLKDATNNFLESIQEKMKIDILAKK